MQDMYKAKRERLKSWNGPIVFLILILGEALSACLCRRGGAPQFEDILGVRAPYYIVALKRVFSRRSSKGRVGRPNP